MDDNNLKKVNDYFAKWRGCSVEFNGYTTSMGNRFFISLNMSGRSTQAHFCQCAYIQGPTHWEKGNFVCSSWVDKDGKYGFELRDDGASFIVRGLGAITAENGEFTVGVFEPLGLPSQQPAAF